MDNATVTRTIGALPDLQANPVCPDPTELQDILESLERQDFPAISLP